MKQQQANVVVVPQDAGQIHHLVVNRQGQRFDLVGFNDALAT